MRRSLPYFFLLTLLIPIVWGNIARATVPQVFYFSGVPTVEQIQKWNTLGPQEVLIQLDYAGEEVLDRLADLKAPLRVEMDRLPAREQLAGWKKLAQKGVGFVLLDGALPRTEDVGILNAIGFQRIQFVVGGYPDGTSWEALKDLNSHKGITFASRFFPRYEDRDGFLAIPEEVPLLFVTDYWPWYFHMDVFNLIPQTLSLRIRGALPSDDHFPYLKNIHRLKSVAVETDFDPGSSFDWKNFGDLPVQWIITGSIPSREALHAYLECHGTGLQIDRDIPLNSDEEERLATFPLPIQWIRYAP